MDYLRSCYRSQMRLYPDRPDILTWGRWHFSPAGAIVAPPSVFFSRRWDDTIVGDDALGEVQQRYYRYYIGAANPRLTGRHYCGSDSVWVSGIPYAARPGLELDASGTPLCCSPLPAAPGGVRIGGRGVWPGVYQVSLVGSVCQCQGVTGATT